LAIVSVNAQHAVDFKPNLLDGVGIETVGESRSSKFFLPDREISSSNWWDSVVLLPLSKVVLVALGEEAHHLGLHAENTSSDERSLHLHLVYIVISLEERGINTVALAEFSSNKILLSLA